MPQIFFLLGKECVLSKKLQIVSPHNCFHVHVHPLLFKVLHFSEVWSNCSSLKKGVVLQQCHGKGTAALEVVHRTIISNGIATACAAAATAMVVPLCHWPMTLLEGV